MTTTEREQALVEWAYKHGRSDEKFSLAYAPPSPSALQDDTDQWEYGAPYVCDWDMGRGVDPWAEEKYAREMVEDSEGARILVRRRKGIWEVAT